MSYNKDNNDIEDELPYKQELNFTKGDNFYIYGDVDESFPKNIIAPFIELVDKKVKESNPTPINFHISSPGGFVQYCFDLISWIEYAKSKDIVINTYVTSVAYSCASIIAVTGTRRWVSKRSQFLLHFARSWDFSHNPEMSDRNKASHDFMQNENIEVYKKYSKLKDIRKKMMSDNFYILGGDELIKTGFADELL